MAPDLKPLSRQEVTAILHLLEVENDETAGLLRQQLLLRSPGDLQVLEAASDEAGPQARRRLRSLLAERRARLTETLYDQFTPLPDGDLDLEEGAFLLARCAYPAVPMLPYRQQLDGLAVRLQRKLPPDRGPEGVVAALSDFLFHQEGFQGNAEQYYDPDNSYMNKVLERRLGIPITLSALMLLLGHRLQLPLVGVGMPGHFIVKYQCNRGEILIDPFNSGRIMPRAEVIAFLKKTGYGFTDHYLAPVSNHTILERMARNLAVIYENQENQAMGKCIADFLQALHQRR